ncbi:preprotein translocase subunit SecG [Amylibacter sp.]|jgi:preprotein translocase subunit SecG|nr:preprotein translocase subunit SecG [Amylibacter sp.]MDC1376560.1 preprotein translocase subunit SecG [Amylibacter sp.]
MQNVVLVIHLILSVSLIGIVLLQRSEGGGLGIGGGGNNSGGGRPKAAPLAKVTWIIAIAFLITSITLTIIAAKNSGGSSVTDGFSTTETDTLELPKSLEGNLLPPSAADEPALPPKAE